MLVCDDEQQILRALRVILRDAGYESMPASTMNEALDLAAVNHPDAAIIDLVLPDGDGVELCRKLREWTDIPLIVLSAVGDEEAKVRALSSGADDYITKPFGPRELIARLEANIRRTAREPEEAVIEAGELRVDLARHTVTVAGEEVHLTPTEFDLLRTLAAQPRAPDRPIGSCSSRCGARATRTTRRCCAPTSRTCAARSNRLTARG